MGCASFGQVKSILVPIDFSPVSRLVVARAVALAQPTKAVLVLLHVVQPPAVLADLEPALPVVQTMSRSAVRQLARCKALVEARGLAAASVCRRGASPALVIAAEAERHASDYIVIGSHGHGAFYDLLVGSTTSGVLRRAHCPVVVVPALQRATQKSPTFQESFGASGPLCEPDQAMSRQRHTVLGTDRTTRSIHKYAN